MFCFQCEQTENGTGCTVVGNCGKTPDVAALQDLLIHALKGLSMYAHRARLLGGVDHDIDRFVPHVMFTTLTNVNFDPDRFVDYLREVEKMRDKAKALYEAKCKEAGKTPEKLSGPYVTWSFNERLDVDSLANKGKAVGVLARKKELGEDIAGLVELITYGLKGYAAYTDHARVLGRESDDVYAFFYEALDKLAQPNPALGDLLALALKVGEYNLKTLANLDSGNTGRFGNPTPTKVRTTPVKGKCIVVSGHDLPDLELVLKQTEGKGINVYTHGELLPAHGYPQLKKYKHLVGNYGGAWQNQKSEFAEFPGAILMTTNCIIEPRKSYKGRIFTRSAVGWPGVKHLEGDDLQTLIDAALEEEGFTEDSPAAYTTTGFGHNAVLGVAPAVIEAVKTGKIKHFFLIGGCDGAAGERNYFKEVALNTPKDSVILTLACGKYRFNKLEFGDIGGIPRLLDVGQCNDAYGAVQIAVALAKAFNTDVNSLPLSFVVSWFEQKAVAVLLSLLYLGIKDIRLGPHLPAFVTPAALQILNQKFGLRPIGTNVQEDIKQMLAKK